MLMDEIALNGIIFKYTNVLFGYQKRYFKLKKGTIYYYLSKEVEAEGCRKFRVLKNFRLEYDDDPCRLAKQERRSLYTFYGTKVYEKNIALVWLFGNEEEKELWENALKSFLTTEKQYQIIQTEQRRESIRSLPPDSSNDSNSKRLVRTVVVEKRNHNVSGPLTNMSGIAQTDLHKLGTLKSQLPGQFQQVMHVLNHIVDTRGGPLDLSIVEQTYDRCKQLADGLTYLQTLLPNIQVVKAEDALNSLLLQESYLSDDEWHDAVSEGPISDDQEIKQSIKNKMPAKTQAIKTESSTGSLTSASENSVNEAPIFSEIKRITEDQLKHALADVDDGWELFVKDGEMRMYKMEKEIDGVMCDPLKAVHTVKGVTAHEFIDIFFDPTLKMEWDDTIVRANVVDKLADNTVVLHQIHKRVWPAAQRESLFWSHRLEIKDGLDTDALNGFMVCNQDCERDDVPLSDSSCVRVSLTIAMVCQTVILNKEKSVDSLNRSDICCKIVYVAQVHPGGWLPTSALRQVYKREYPKFLRQFSAYVVKKCKDKPLKL